MAQSLFNKIIIFGVGLIGGSFALALRKANAVGEVVSFGRSAATLQEAQQLGIFDRIGGTRSGGCRGNRPHTLVGVRGGSGRWP